jgi:hypothetical protein
MMYRNDQIGLQEELFHLAAYMVTSARGLYDEPADYGIFRLLDSSGRLLAIMESQGFLDPFLADLKKMVDDEREGNMDYEGQRERLDKAVLDIAREMQNRL